MRPQAESPIDWLELWGILSYFGREFERRSEAVLQEAGLSHVQLRLLYNLIYSTEPLSLSELARRLGCGKSNVAQLMDRMHKDDLVRRIPHEQDRRRRHAFVTEEGKRRLREALLAVSAAGPRILGELESSDREELACLLTKSLALRERSRDALRVWSRVVEATNKVTVS